MLTKMIQALINGLGTLLNVATALPQSPFDSAIKYLGQASFLGYLSYFFPIRDMLMVLQYWLVAIFGFYLVKTYLRFMKVIE